MRNFPRYLTAEVKDIIVAVAVLTAAFTIVLSRFRGAFGGSLAIVVVASFLTVLTSFLLHELAHRYVARLYGGIAFFKMWIPGIFLLLVSSLFGVIFAAPGAVNIGGIFRKDQIGKTALAGPATNLGIGIILYIVVQLLPVAWTGYTFYNIVNWMSGLNLWFALFNLIPISPLDGEKIFRWDLHIYLVMVAVAIVMNILNGLFL